MGIPGGPVILGGLFVVAERGILGEGLLLLILVEEVKGALDVILFFPLDLIGPFSFEEEDKCIGRWGGEEGMEECSELSCGGTMLRAPMEFAAEETVVAIFWFWRV